MFELLNDILKYENDNLKKYRQDFEKQKRILKYENAVESLEKGILTSLPTAYCGLIEYDSEYIKHFGRILTTILDNLPSDKIIRLSETFRKTNFMNYACNWEKFNINKCREFFECEKDYVSVLAIGSFHPNGYFREECLKRLSAYDNTTHYIILRLNDWVGNIRKIAENIIKDKIKLCSPSEIFSLSIYADKVLHSGRRNYEIFCQIHSYMKDIIDNHADDIDIYSIKNYDFKTRKSIYKLLCRKPFLSAEKFETMINLEKHNFCQSYLISKFLQFYTPDMDKTDELLNHKSWNVRYQAMQYKYNCLKNIWQGIEKFLLDKRKTIREYTIFLLKKHTDFDIPEFYRKNLTTQNCIYAITGLGETGKKSDAELIKPYLSSEYNKIVIHSISAICNLTGSENEDIYWQYLFNENIGIAKSAYNAIIKAKISYGAETIYKKILSINNEATKRYLVLIICANEDSWERLPYLIKFYHNDTFKSIHNKIYYAINRRNIYKKISPELERKIRNVISCYSGEMAWAIKQDLKLICRK